MQLIAFDQFGAPVKATQACRHHLYQCPECGRPLALRSGRRYQLHFYHTQGRGECRQAGKSITHLYIQQWIAAQLPNKEGILEHRFEEIGRIADVYWPSKSLVFEVQCSDISPEEVLSRNADYGRLDLTVVWILHQRRFRRHTHAEEALSHWPTYYTAMRPGERGAVFDQLEQNGPRFPIAIERPLGACKLPPGPWHPSLKTRWWSFAGDASCTACGPNPPDCLRHKRPPGMWRLLLKRVLCELNR